MATKVCDAESEKLFNKPPSCHLAAPVRITRTCGVPNRKPWQWQLGDLQKPSEMHGRPQVRQPLRLGAYAMQLIADAAVIELELRTPAYFLLHAQGQGCWTTPSTRCPPLDTTVVCFTV